MKRKLSELQVQRQDQAKRHQAWLGRSNIGTTAASWRPNPMHRVASKHWALCLDNAFRTASGKPGLQFFEPSKTPEWSDWRKHPFAVLGMDQGSDNVCGLHALQYHDHLNVEGYMDTSHGF